MAKFLSNLDKPRATRRIQILYARVQHCLPKSLLLYADPPTLAIQPVPPLDAPRLAVLDTNVVLDWLLFGHPDGAVLDAAVTTGELRWIATQAMCDEFAHVLARGTLARWQPDAAALKARWAAHCDVVPAPIGPLGRPRCTDPDDQKFIDLAASRTGCLLLSRDRAVLKLARKLSALGVTLTTPTAWVAARAFTSSSSPSSC